MFQEPTMKTKQVYSLIKSRLKLEKIFICKQINAQQRLKDIDPTITGVQLIPHSRSRLKIFQSLQQYFDKHEVETELVGNESSKQKNEEKSV